MLAPDLCLDVLGKTPRPCPNLVAAPEQTGEPGPPWPRQGAPFMPLHATCDIICDIMMRHFAACDLLRTFSEAATACTSNLAASTLGLGFGTGGPLPLPVRLQCSKPMQTSTIFNSSNCPGPRDVYLPLPLAGAALVATSCKVNLVEFKRRWLSREEYHDAEMPEEFVGNGWACCASWQLAAS